MGKIEQIFRQRDLGALDAILGTAILATSVFMWAERSKAVDPDVETADSWAWQLWQIGPLVFSLVGVGLLWANTRRVAWVRTLFLSLLGLVILINRYTDGFGDHVFNVWYTVDPLFVACATVAAFTGWHRVLAQRKTSGSINLFSLCAAELAAGLGIAVLICNFFFFTNATVWQILDPLMLLALLIWAIAARRTNVGNTI